METNELAIAYQYQPAVLSVDYVGIETRIAEMVEPYQDMTEEAIEKMDVKQAKACRADLNRISKELNACRIAVKKVYSEPLNEFERRIKELDRMITEPRDMLDGCIKRQEESFRSRRYDMLECCYLDFLEANGITELERSVTFDRILDMKWLNKSTNDVKAMQLLEERLGGILADWKALNCMDFFDANEAEACFMRTLDLRQVMENDAAKRDEAERLEALHRQMEEAKRQRELMEAEHAPIDDEPCDLCEPAEVPEPVEPEPEPQQAMAAEQQEPDPSDIYVWTVRLQATEQQVRQLAKVLNEMGLHGSIKKGIVNNG